MTYWTGTWDPSKEAISKELASLRVGTRLKAPVVSFAPGQRSSIDLGARVAVLSGRAWPALRVLASVIEPRGDVTHVFGGRNSWHLVRALGRRPIVLTAVVPGASTARLPAVELSRVVVETESGADEWVTAGVPEDRISLIRPGIDLERYRPMAREPGTPFRLLFASTPADSGEIEARGIPLLVELARSRPDLEVTVPWRNWGDVGAARRVLHALRPPENFVVSFGDIEDMRTTYAQADATMACFAAGTGKTCPSFVLEALATGRPAILTPSVGLAALVTRHGAGVQADRSVQALVTAVDRVRADWPAYSKAARRLAESAFGLDRFRTAYDRLYEDVAPAYM